MTTETFIPSFALGFFGGASDRCRAMQGKPTSLAAIVEACRAAIVEAVICDAEGSPVGIVDRSGSFVRAETAESFAFGDRVLHRDGSRWVITTVSGVTPAWARDGYCRVDVLGFGQADARFSTLRALPV